MKRDLVFIGGLLFVAAGLSGCATTPGLIAIQQGSAEQLKQILNQPKHGGEDIDSLLYESVVDSNCLECVRILFQEGAKPGTFRQGHQDGSGYFVQEPGLDGLLAVAAWHGHAQVAKFLVDRGAEPASAMALIRGWGAGPGLQASIDVFKKIEQDRSSPATPAVHAVENSYSSLSPSFHEAEHPHDYALIVGVEKYADLPAATYADADAEAAAAFVHALGVPARNMVTLTGARATRSGLAKQLEGWLANNVNENSTVYFYYSGHGAPDPKSGQAYLVPIDGDPQYLDQTGYPLKRVYKNLAALKAKRVVVMLDSCFSGAGGRSVLAKGARPLMTHVDTGLKTADGKILVLSASGPDQISGTSEETGHGLFTYHLLTGLNGAAADAKGRVTIQSLYDYLKPKVMDDAHRANREQDPQLQAVSGTADNVILREK